MHRIAVEHRFAAPPRAVWDVYTDHAGWSEWAGCRRSWLEVEGAPDRNGTGAVRGIGNGLVRVLEEVHEFDPPRRMTYSIVRGPLPLRSHVGEVVFEPDGEGTRVVWRSSFETKIPGLGALVGLAVSLAYRRALRRLERHHFPSLARSQGDGSAARAALELDPHDSR